MHVHLYFKGDNDMTSDSPALNILAEVQDTDDPRWLEQDWINGYLPTSVPFRWRRLVCQSEGCDEKELACAVQGEGGEWNYIFSQESDFVADMNEDSLYCETHALEFG